MAKFNGTNKSVPTGTNEAGGVSYDRPIKKEIATVVLNSMLNGDKFYENETDRLARIETLIKSSGADSEFVAKAMVYTRTEGRLRSVSHFMANMLAENVKGESFLRPAFVKAMVRPDDMTEMLSLWNTRNKGKMIPNSLRRAFKTALETKFDEYQFRKYAASKSTVKLKDVVKLAHPSPKGFEDQTIFKRVIEDKLKTIETAQTINASKSGTERVDAYVAQIKSGKIGYMAAVKNIKTMLENGISEADLKVWANFITDPKRVSRSMMLPTRFLDGWRACESLSMDKFKKDIVKKALERAFVLSAGNTNIAEEGEKVAVLLDDSYSMDGQPFDTGITLMAALLANLNKSNSVGYLWSDRAREVDVEKSAFQFISENHCRGGGTDVSAPLKLLISTKTYVDKIVIFTDMQMYGGYGNMGDQVKSYINKYKKDINPNVKVLFWNLQGYGGGAPIDMEKTPEIFEVSGFSDKMLEVIPRLWSNPNFLIETIEAIKL